MKFFFGIIFVTVTALVQKSEEALTWKKVSHAKQSVSAFNYHNKFGIAEASRIKEAEARKPNTSKLTAFHHNSSGDEPINWKITNGVEAKPRQFPYQAGLLVFLSNGEVSVCGASLVSSKRLVTAAHCWYDGVTRANYLTVVLGTTKLFRGGLRIDTNKVVMHEKWNPRSLANDIAMISINEIKFTVYIKPVALPLGYEKESFKGATVLASGFGITGDYRGISPDQYLSYVLLNVTDCKSYVKPNLVRGTICATGKGGKNVCDGDSGGPLVVNIKNVLTLIGITSFGSVSCTNGRPAAYTRVTSYLDWIQKFL